jgi:Fe2+ or Zn2+ uptake regulation protein
MSKLLISEHPLQVLPSLAVAIGLNEAIVLQQVHYWLQTKPKMHDGRPWVYNSATEWQQQFPFWSVPTIRRILNNLREAGILEVGNFNPDPQDRTLWYTINYAKLPCNQSDQLSCDQSDQMGVSDDDHLINLITPFDQPDHLQVINSRESLYRTETTTETNNREKGEAEARARRKAPPPPSPAASEQTAPQPVTEQPILYDTRKLKAGKVTAGAGSTPCEVLFEFIPYDSKRLSISILERVNREATDLAKWRETLTECDGLGWQPYNIADRLDVYRNGFRWRKDGQNRTMDANGAQPGGSGGTGPATPGGEQKPVVDWIKWQQDRAAGRLVNKGPF